MRVTQKMWQSSLMRSINLSYDRMANIDMRRRVTKPSDDPSAAEQMIRIRSMLSRNEQYQDNVASASRWLTYSETALSAAASDIGQVKVLALTAADDANPLEGLEESLDSLFDDMLRLANSEHGGRYLFGGSAGRQAPFVESGNQVIYRGNDQELSTAISNGLSLRYNIPGSQVFGSVEAGFQGTQDWNPEANWTTPLDRLMDGTGLDMGRIKITDGAGDFAVVDLRGATSLGDIRDRIETALPSLEVTIVDGERLQVTDTANPGSTLTIADVQGDLTAATLGIAGTGSGGSLLSRDLDPMLADDTALTDLRGMTLPLGSIGIRVGGATELLEVDLSGAATVGDIRDLLHAAAPELNVNIAPTGNRLQIEGVGLTSIEIADFDGDLTAGLIGLSGSDVPIRPFGVIIDFKEAVANEDRDRIRELLPEIEKLEEHFLSSRAAVGNRLNLAEDALTTLDTRNFNLTSTLSDIGDADMAEALIHYQSAESVYQASLLMASNIFQMSLSNFL
jgi:flagellar hook-associated protein 3